MDKLVKAINSMKAYYAGSAVELVEKAKKDQVPIPTKNERQENCKAIVECILSSQLKNNSEYSALLGVTLETLLQGCQDDEVDVRLAAEESLNRIIRGVDEQMVGKILLEFYKEIKKNGQARSLKAALARFSNLVHKIRPNKCRPYIVSLLPCLIRICQRQEDLIQECLASSIPKIFYCLGSFAGYTELRNFLEPLFRNLSSKSATTRRTAASCVQEIVKNARNKAGLLSDIVSEILSNLATMSHSKNDVIGGLIMFRHLVPLIVEIPRSKINKKDEPSHQSAKRYESFEQLFLKILESCVHFFCSEDTNIVTASLETLQSLFKHPCAFLQKLEKIPSLTKSEFTRRLVMKPVPSTAGQSIEEEVKLVLEEVISNVESLAIRDSTLKSQSDPPESENLQDLVIPANEHYMNQIGDIYLENPVLAIAKILCERILKVEVKSSRGDVRVSVKNIALSCLSHLIKLRPKILLTTVNVLNDDKSETTMKVFEVLSYQSHYDPHLKGYAFLVAARYISSALIKSKYRYCEWLANNNAANVPDKHTSIENLVTIIATGLSDASSVTNRACISAISCCLQELFHSENILLGLKLLSQLLKLKDTSYWLVKVDVLDLLSKINYHQLLHVTECTNDMEKWKCYLDAKKIQEDILLVGFTDLNHSDNRVRNAASKMLVSCIGNMDIIVDSCLCDMATSQVAKICNTIYHASPMTSAKTHTQSGEVKTLLKAYRGYEKSEGNSFVSHNLSVIVGKITTLLSSSTSKNLTQGCIQVLLSLTEKYPVSQFPSSYGCTFHDVKNPQTNSFTQQQNFGLLPVLSSMLNSAWLPPDVTIHAKVLLLAGNFLAGGALHGFNTVGPNPKINDQESLIPTKGSSPIEESTQWSSILEPTLGAFATKFFSHILKLISIFHHVIGDVVPSTQNKSVLPSLPTAQSIPSPLNKKEKPEQKDVTQTPDQSSHKKTGSLGGDETEKEKIGSKSKTPFGFASSRVYMKLYDILVGAYDSYKTTSENGLNERFCSFLHTVLDVFCQVMEIATFSDVEKYTEEILMYFKSTFLIDPALTVQSVQQLLKGLFGTNLVSQIELDEHFKTKLATAQHNKDPQPYKSSFYHQVFHHPLNDLTMAIANASFHHYLQSETTQKASGGWFGSIKKKVEKKLTLTAKRTKGEKTSIQNYIRLFESIVIKSLKTYTMTSSVNLQKQVLNLLAQLVQLRVNYCLLDSDQIFVGFIIKQFEAIEGGLIKNSESLIPHIFFFLVLLSYEKHHSKTVMTMSKIIQLCDGIMASGCDPFSHAIPALQPIVHDIFLLRGNLKHDVSSDLDTQREVLQSMLFRIIEYPAVLTMVTTILQYYRKENPDQWKKSSRQVTDVLLPKLTHLKLHIFKYEDMSMLHRLFEALSPNALRPIDLLLNIFFLLPSELHTISLHQRWMMKTLALLRVLLCHSKEDYILLRIKETKMNSDTFSCESLKDLLRLDNTQHSIPLPVPQVKAHDSTETPPQDVLSRTFIQLIGFTINRLVDNIYDPVKITGQNERNTLLAQLLSEFLLTVTYMCRSGSFKNLTRSLKSILQDASESGKFYSSKQISKDFDLLGSHFPVVTLLWSQLIACVGYTDMSAWERLTGRVESLMPCLILHREIVYRGSVIMLADYVSQNQAKLDLMNWLVQHHTREIIVQQSEPPIQDLICAIHKIPSASELLVKSIQLLCDSGRNVKPAFKKRILYCLKGLHLDQSHSLLFLLFSDWFLFSPIVAVFEFSLRMACERVEMIMGTAHSDEDKQVILSQLQEKDASVQRLRASRKFILLTLLIERMKSNLESGSDPPLTTQDQNSAVLCCPDKQWYKNLSSSFCFEDNKSSDVARVLSVLDYEDIIEIMKNDKFTLAHIDECITFGISEITCPSSAAVPYAEDITSSLLKASLETLVAKFDSIVELFPLPMFDSEKLMEQSVFELNESGSKISQYWLKLFKILEDHSLRSKIFLICKILTRCFLYRRYIEHPFEVLSKMDDKFVRLIGLCFEAITWGLCNGVEPTVENELIALEFLTQCLQKSQLQVLFYSSENSFLPLTIANCLYVVLKLHSGEAKVYNLIECPGIDGQNSAASVLKADCTAALIRMKICQLMDQMYENKVGGLPAVLEKPFRCAVVQILTHTHFNSMACLPPLLIKNDMSLEELESLSKEKSGEYLQDKCVLKEFINRINSLGWISRMQFEETWTTLLGVLVSQPIGDNSQNASPVDEEAINISCLTIRALTALVVNSCMKPHGGKPGSGAFQTVPRKSGAKVRHTKIGGELSVVQCIIDKELREVTYGDQLNEIYDYYQAASNSLEISDSDMKNIDVLRSRLQQNIERREKSPLYYGLGQRSVQSFRDLYNIQPLDDETTEYSTDDDITEVESSDDLNSEKGEVSQRPPLRNSPSTSKYQQQRVDAHSCVQFLIDLFSEWFHSASTTNMSNSSTTNVPVYTLKLPRQFLCECLSSLLLISDFFTERQQFEWMFTSLNSLLMAQPLEDEVMLQYLVLGMCKAGAILGMNKKICIIIEQLLDTSLGSTLVSTQSFALHGALYVLECEQKDSMKAIVNTISKHVCEKFRNIQSGSSGHSHQLIRNVIAVGFILIEQWANYITNIHAAIFIQGAIAALANNEQQPVSNEVFFLLLKSLDNLVTSYSLSSLDCDAVAKLASDLFSNSKSLPRTLASLNLIMSCMYYQLMRVSDSQSPTKSSKNEEEEREARLLSMERITFLFDKIRSGLPQESRILIQLLPRLLDTFFTTEARMNKVIGEFVSGLHPFPNLIATVVHDVFQALHSRGESAVVCEWVMLSLGNFTQRTPISTAIWCLTCVFISASTNPWINSLLPMMLSQVHSEKLDYQNFYTVAHDFYTNQLTGELDRRSFHSIFKAVATPGSPYQHLLDVIDKIDVEA